MQLVGAVISLFIAAPINAQAPATPSKFVLFLGQSNMSGRTPLDPVDFTAVPPARLFDDTNNWQIVANIDAGPNSAGGLDQGVNRYSPIRKQQQDQLLSPAFAFARRVLPTPPIGLLVEARGGISITQMKENAPPPSDSGFTQNLFLMIVDRTLAAKETGSTLSAVVWLQGESDAIHFGQNYPGTAADMDSYLEQLAGFITVFRWAVAEPDLPFVISGIMPVTAYPSAGNYNYPGTFTFNQRIHEITSRVDNVSVVYANDTQSLYQQDATNNRCPADCVHFTHRSSVLMGTRYADQVNRILYRKASAPALVGAVFSSLLD